MHEMGGRAVEADLARPALALDHVGLEPGAVVDVDHGDLLVLEQVGPSIRSRSMVIEPT